MQLVVFKLWFIVASTKVHLQWDGLTNVVQCVIIPKLLLYSVVKPDESCLMCLAFSSDYDYLGLISSGTCAW